MWVCFSSRETKDRLVNMFLNEVASKTNQAKCKSIFSYGNLCNKSKNNTTISLLWREMGPSFLKNTDFPPRLWYPLSIWGSVPKNVLIWELLTQLLTRLPKKWVDSELSALYICALNTIPHFSKEVSRGVAFLQFPELLLEISAFRISPGWGKKWEDNRLDMFTLKISPLLFR